MTLTSLPPSLGSPSFQSQSKDNHQSQSQSQSPYTYTSTPETALLNLIRLTARLERNLLTPSPATAENIHALKKDVLRRGRVGANITYAQTNLTTLEKSLPSIKPVSRRHEIQTEVLRLRGVLRELGAVVEDASSVSPGEGEEDDDDEENKESGEDLLETPEGEVEEEVERELDHDIHATTTTATPTKTPTETEMETKTAIPTATEQPTPEPTPTSTTTSTLRNRHHHHHTPSSSHHPPTPPNPNLPTTEKTLTTHLHEQETLTTSLLSLATQLKTSSQTFQSTLDTEKSVLNRAVSDLDRTSSSMDAAERRMGMLRRMTEGKGWWGRMMLYAWIVAGWLIAVGIVFLGPKVRF